MASVAYPAAADPAAAADVLIVGSNGAIGASTAAEDWLPANRGLKARSGGFGNIKRGIISK